MAKIDLSKLFQKVFTVKQKLTDFYKQPLEKRQEQVSDVGISLGKFVEKKFPNIPVVKPIIKTFAEKSLASRYSLPSKPYSQLDLEEKKKLQEQSLSLAMGVSGGMKQTSLREAGNVVRGLVGQRPQTPPIAGSVPRTEAIPGREISSSGEIITDPVKKIVTALREAKPIRGAQEALYKQERGQKLARMMGVREKTTGEKGFFSELGSLRGELSKVDYESVREKVGQTDIDELFNRVKDTNLMGEWDKVSARVGLSKILGEKGGTVPTTGELKLLNKVFGQDFTKALLDKRSTWQKFLSQAEEAINLPRSLMASFDLSAPLRQGVFLIGRPKQWVPAFKSMFKQFGSQKAWNEVQSGIVSRPTYQTMRDNGLSLTDMDTVLGTREEAFLSSWGEKIPIVKEGVKASNRAYTGFLNKLRADTFDDLLTQGKKLGIGDDPNYLKSVASFVNNATGRGELGGLERAAGTLNGLLFSPRLMASRLNLMNPAYYVKLNPQVRKEAVKSLLTFLGTGMTVLGLSKAAGAKVSGDPTNADFGKIKIGNTRMDIWGGFQQYIKLAAQLQAGKITSSTTGKEITLGEGYKPMTRLDIVERFMRGKANPVVSTVLDLMEGKTVTGEKLNIDNTVVQKFIPMVIQDMKDAYKEWGTKGVAISIPSIFGVGTQTYGGTPTSIEEAEQRGTVDLYRFLKTQSPEESNKYISGLGEDKEDVVRKLEKFKDMEGLGLGEKEWAMVGTGIQNGERSDLIIKQLNQLKNREEKNAYMEKLDESGLVDDEIYDQLRAARDSGRLGEVKANRILPKPTTVPIKEESYDLIEPFKKGSISERLLTKSVKSVPVDEKVAQRNIPPVIDALQKEGILSPEILAYALATIEHETGGTFKPIEEYDGRNQAINRGYSGGENFFGRGFIQLTHDYNYKEIGKRIGMGDKLFNDPSLALDPVISAKILAAFFKDRGVSKLASKKDFVGARSKINPDKNGQLIAQKARRYLVYLSK